jgi:ubiquinone/menaquinone biosynthesis C-methylase UbiE
MRRKIWSSTSPKAIVSPLSVTSSFTPSCRRARAILDVGANTGRGGLRLADLDPGYEITALDCVQSRLDALPKCYSRAILGLSNTIPADDRSFDAVLAGEFLEHLYPSDVDPTLCEFQRVLKDRLALHGFSRVKVYGSGKVSRYLGYYVPAMMLYGSYLIVGDKI